MHIQEFTRYVDASVNSLAHELKQWIPALVDERIAQTKVQMDVDEPSMRKVKAKISELFSSIGRWENKITSRQSALRVSFPTLDCR